MSGISLDVQENLRINNEQLYWGSIKCNVYLLFGANCNDLMSRSHWNDVEQMIAGVAGKFEVSE